MKESDTGLAALNLWDLVSNHEYMAEQPLQVAQCIKTILMDPKKVELAHAVNPDGAPQGQKGADKQEKYNMILSSSVLFDAFMFLYS